MPPWKYRARVAASILATLPFQSLVLAVCSGLISAAGINILTKSNSGKEEIYYLTILGHSPSQREAGTTAQTETLLCGSCSSSLHLHRDDTTHGGLRPPTSINY